MSPETVGIIGIVLLLVLFLLRMPVAFAMALVGFAGFAYLNGVESALALLYGLLASGVITMRRIDGYRRMEEFAEAAAA